MRADLKVGLSIASEMERPVFRPAGYGPTWKVGLSIASENGAAGLQTGRVRADLKVGLSIASEMERPVFRPAGYGPT